MLLNREASRERLGAREPATLVRIGKPALGVIVCPEQDARGATVERMLADVDYALPDRPTRTRCAVASTGVFSGRWRLTRGSLDVAFRALSGFSDDRVSVCRDVPVALCGSPPVPVAMRAAPVTSRSL